MVKKKNLVEIEKPQNNNVIRPVCPEKKTWRQHQVDINLKEKWLEKLNLLKRFKLTSVCKWHYDPENPQRIRNYPQVAIKFNFMKGFDVLSLFEQKGRKLKDILKKCFNEKYINAEFHYHFDVAASSYSCEFIFNC